MDFSGVSAFPLTPLKNGCINFRELTHIIEALNTTAVSSLGVLGSTGGYMYHSTAQRANIIRSAVTASDKPVIAGVSDLTLHNVLKHVNAAQKAGAAALMLAPVSYQRLTPDEVYGLYYQVDRATDIPVVLYDNPATTGFTFTDELYSSITALQSIASIKIPQPAPDVLVARISGLQAQLPQVAIGISGDHQAFDALVAGTNLWYSAIAGTLPELALALATAAQNPTAASSVKVLRLAQPLFATFTQYGSYRTIDALALIAGKIQESSLVAPLKAIPAQTQGVLKDWYEIYQGQLRKGLLQLN